MKKISAIALVLASVILLCAAAPSAASAETLIDFKPVLKNGKIYGIPVETTVATLKYAYYDYDIDVYDAEGNEITSSSQFIGTGYTVKINSIAFVAVVMGDVDGDGKITVFDYSAVKHAYLGYSELSYISGEAAEVENGEVRAINYIKIKRAYFDTYDINRNYVCEPYDPVGDESGWTPGWV